MPIIVATTVFKWLFDSDYGILNALLSKLPGVDMIGHNWFASGPQGLAVIMLLVVWGAVPFVVITLSAGLTQVPKELEEAARLDGAGAWGVFRYVTLPDPQADHRDAHDPLGHLGHGRLPAGLRDAQRPPRGRVPAPDHLLVRPGLRGQRLRRRARRSPCSPCSCCSAWSRVYMRQMLKIGEVE